VVVAAHRLFRMIEMRKLNKKTVVQLVGLFKDLNALQGDIESAVLHYNEAIWDLNSALQNIAGDIESYMDDRSEKWYESERADQYQEWLSFFEVEKDEVDEPDFEHGELEDLPVEVNLV